MTGEAMKVKAGEMLTTQEWKDVLDILWKEAGTSQVSFTGGEPTERPDLVELIAYAQEFTTRLNTNGRKLADLAYCWQLKKVSLDVAQITVYSSNANTHNMLVGAKGAWAETMQGIRNAVSVDLEVSVNIPLVDANVRGLAETIEYLYNNLGVRYFTCSGLLPAGGAKQIISSGRAATADVLYKELRRAKVLAKKLNLELDFTSPGVLTRAQLMKLGFNNPPVCGACLGNMAISPKGVVLPCQSWVHDSNGLGSILETPWKQIWNNPMCKRIRKQAIANEGLCSLPMEVK
jgi:MoaA/NifB/PqqE/SkfB family radical SAM enzyme